MDISRLPLASPGRPATYFRQPQAATSEVEAVEVLQSTRGTRRESPAGRVVQGELLQRERNVYQSTQGYINERGQDAGRNAVTGSDYQSRSAISRYVSHTRPESPGDLTQGRAINFFV